jgi:protein-glutamine gamma-glutamyltransferase
MTVLDGSAHRSQPVGVGSVRPAGWSPGTGTLFGAWLASAAIARLTGASAVILLLAAALVAMTFEIVAGWWSARTADVRSVVAPTVANVGELVELFVTVEGSTAARSVERRRITLMTTDGTVVSVHDTSTTARPAGSDADHPTPTAVVTARFETAGVVTALIVRLDVAGPAGLVWWKRVRTVAVEPLHVAPVAHGPLVTFEASASTSEGCHAARRGNHGGEIDGVRPWRPGDATNSVHWASSLRTDELIVHDRLTATDQRWLVDLDAGDAGQLRWTFDEARRQGHDVDVQTGDGDRHAVLDDDDAARWSAIAAQARADRDRADASPRDDRRVGILHRQIRLRTAAIETATAITGPTRWAAAAAAFASMAMLIGAIGGSAATFGIVLAAVVAGAAVSLWVARRGGRRPLVMQAAIVGVILAALAVIAAQAVDVDGLLAALRGPLPNVLMLLVVLHGFETVDRRTLRVHLAITFVLASYAAGLRIDAALGWWLAAWGVPFVVSMLTTLRPPGGGGSDMLARRAAVPRRRPTAGSARTMGRRIASIVAIGAVTLAVLSLVPIPDGPARLGLPALSSNAPSVLSPGGLARPDGSTAPSGAESNPDRGLTGGVVGYPGFTEALDTSIRGELGDEIVMRVRAPEPAFWRGQTFTEFDGRTWTVSPELGRPQDGPVIDVPATVGDALGSAVPSRELVQTYFVEQDLPNVVFAAPRPVQVIFDGSLWTRPDGALRSDVTLTAGSVYTVISERPQVDARILRAQGDLGEFFAGFRTMAGGEELDPFLELPESTTQRTVDLATTLRTPGESTYDTILAYEAWLGANTEYDLDAPVPAAGADAVDDFLFESQLGFCEQIASTLTIMLRSQGVPARLATGYVPGERDRVSGVWNVRGSDAHAWVEVWFPQTGWQPFDPTAEVPLAADAGGETVGGDLIGALVSSIGTYRLEIGIAVLVAAVAWGLVSVVALVRYRRRRGRWGLLQDRFGALAAGSSDAAMVATNARIASTLAHDDRANVARTVADELDRAGFDPSWVDDDERYERTRSALVTLERSRR